MERRLTAILCPDMYGRPMGEDEEATLRTLTSHRKLIESSIEQHHGRFVNSAGDSVLAVRERSRGTELRRRSATGESADPGSICILDTAHQQFQLRSCAND